MDNKRVIVGKWYVRILEDGDRYGLDDCLEWQSSRSGVEFYDYSQDKEKFGHRGQFVSRYYVETLLEDAMLNYYGRNNRIDFCVLEPYYFVEDKDMRVIIKFLEEFANVR